MISRTISATAIVLVLGALVVGQTRNFIPVEGANLKAKLDSAIIVGKAAMLGQTGDERAVAFFRELLKKD